MKPSSMSTLNNILLSLVLATTGYLAKLTLDTKEAVIALQVSVGMMSEQMKNHVTRVEYNADLSHLQADFSRLEKQLNQNHP